MYVSGSFGSRRMVSYKMAEYFFIISALVGALLVLENWSLQQAQGRLKGMSVMISALEFIWFGVTCYVVWTASVPSQYMFMPISFLLYNVVGWIVSSRYVEFGDMWDIDTIGDDKKALEAMQQKMQDDFEMLKNTRIPKWILDAMLYFTVLYTLGNIYVVVKIFTT